MRPSVVVGVCGLALLAGTASAADAPQAPPPSATALPTEGERAQPVKQVALDPTAPYPVCRRVAPTGSRIKNEVCETQHAGEKAREAEREQIRRDLDEMRARQALRDQARAQALSEAMRRR